MTLEQEMARTWLEVNVNALLANYHEAKSLCKPGTALIAVLKADAYGYGARPIARVLYEDGERYFSVACVSEAMEIRRELPDAWILNMGATPESQIETALSQNIRLTVGTAGEAKAVSAIAERMGKTAYVHFKVDTGLHRLGFYQEDIAPLTKLPHIYAEGLYSHLALRSRAQSEEQYRCFIEIAESLRQKGVHFDMLHLVDSIGLERYNDWQLDAARVGAFLYGNVPPDYAHFDRRQPVGRFCTRVTRVETIPAGEGIGYDDEPLKKDTRVATLAVGYVDGYARALSKVGQVEIRGKRAKVLGLICMDQMMVDVSEIPDAAFGDVAVLLGDGISLNEYAAWGGLNRNEATAVIGRRVPRIYLRDGKVTGVLDRMDE